ncbi:MAG: hypothetical protein CSA09_03515 [Candidatus Contendobacter odensis]|uniref:Uncharacterized protein n=1 Tax=Candidatus Contendibacter odensensis TaxID=1400860 RepID=A0A2G6PF13_9GAMM|nr:MAG: hypothetical protein CSA09_03515 [Candidatus Contendobacter odensis]
MKNTILATSILITLLFICYRLLFIFLDISSIFMESDSDINSAGKAFLFACPVLFMVGIWTAYRVFRVYAGTAEYKKHVVILFSLYGGLLGVVIADIVIHSLSVTMQSYLVVGGILAISFFASAVATFYGTKGHLTKSSSRR